MKIYVTFGQEHIHKINNKVFDKDCVAMIEVDNYAAGREKAFELFGKKFFTTHREEQVTEKLLSFYPRGIISVQ